MVKWQVLLLLFLQSGISLQAQKNKVHFTNVTTTSGIEFRYTFGDTTYENILESSGSGITVFDYNNDGYMDIYLLNGTYLEGISDPEGIRYTGSRNALYRNNGDGTFTETGRSAGVDDKHWSMAAGPVDIDHDGDTDLFLLNYGPNVFYRNNGDGTFTDITDALGLRGPEKLNGFTKWSVDVAFWDFDQDGRMDAMVGNFLAFDPDYVSHTAPEMMPHPSEYKGQASILYHQEQDGTFTDVTARYGMYFPESKCMGLTVWDYDDDGDLDLFQGNDHQLNFLFRNDNLNFTDVGIAAGVAANSNGIPTGSMHGSIGDVDGDGLIDLFVSDLRYGALYKNLGNGLFRDITEQSGVAAALNGKGSWAAILFDCDNDGDPDLFSANGTAEELILQYPVLLINNGKGIFRNAGTEAGAYFGEKRSGRAAATLDYDNDGDLDIIVSHLDLKATPALLRNDNGNRNHWLGMTLVGTPGPESTVAAKITVVTATESRVIVHQPGTSYLSFHDPRVHVGLGQTQKVNRIIIRWSDGKQDVISNPPVDRYFKVVQGRGIIPAGTQ